MRSRTPEALFEAAQLTREMVVLTERFLDGKATAVEVETWARKIDRQIFRCWIADDLHTCLYNIGNVRRQDLEWHLAEIRAGETRFDDVFARINLPLSEVARRTRGATARFYIDGLGIFERVRFASLATSRIFLAYVSLAEPRDTMVATVHHPKDLQQQREVVQDLFDTLVIDQDETTYLDTPPLTTWRLSRLDDNGNTAPVKTFTGYAKARAALAEYEAKGHKQSLSIAS